MNGRLSLRYALTLFFYNRRIIVTCVVLGALIGLAGAVLSPRRYTAEALLLLNPDGDNAQRSLSGLATALPLESFFTRMVESDVQIISSDPVLRSAVQHLGDTPPGDLDRAVEQLHSRLQVKTQTDSNIIRIIYTDTNRARAIATVDAIIQSYGQRRTGAYISGSTVAQQKEVNDYADKLRSIDTQVRDVQSQADVLNIAQDVQIASNRLDDVTERARQAHQRLNAVRAELGEAGSELAHAPPAVLDSRESSTAKVNDEARNTLAKLQVERQRVAEQYTSDWPGLHDLDERIAAAKLQVAASDRAFSTTERRVRNPVVSQVLGKSADLRIEQASLVQQTAQLDGEVSNARARVAVVRNAQHDLAALQRKQDVMENLYKSLTINSVSAQLHDRELDRKGAGVRVLQPAAAPLRPSGHALLLLIAGILLGIAGALICTIVATLFRQEFITPAEAVNTLQLPLLGIVSHDASEFDTPAQCEALRPLADHIEDTTIDGRPLRSIRILTGDAASLDVPKLARCLGTLLADRDRRGVLVVDDGPDSMCSAPTRLGQRRSLRVGEHEIDLSEQELPGVWKPTPAAAAQLAAANLSQVKIFLEQAAQHFRYVLVLGDRAHRASRGVYQQVDANLIFVLESETRGPIVRQLRETILASGGNLIGFAYFGRQLHIPEKVYQWL